MNNTRIVNVELSAMIEQVREISIEVPEHISDEAIDNWLRTGQNVDWLHKLADEEEIYWEEAPGYPERKERKAGVLYCCATVADRVAIPKSLVKSLERAPVNLSSSQEASPVSE